MSTPLVDGTGALPLRRADLEVARFDTAAVVFDPNVACVHLLDAVALAVLESCDGTTAKSEVVDDVVEALQLSNTDARALVDEAIDELAAKGMIESCSGTQVPPRLEPLEPPGRPVRRWWQRRTTPTR